MSSDSLEGFNIVVNQPALSKDGPKSNKPWKYLSKFELTCQGMDKVRCPVYANGRQQVPIQINVEARDEDGVIVDVNHAGLYLYLCKYDDIDVFPTELGRTATEDPRFIYQWSIQKADADDEESHILPAPVQESERVQSVSQFVSANKVGTYKLAVRCRSPEKVIFVTNTPNPPEGKFDSWLLIDAREPKATPWQSFSISAPKTVVANSDWEVNLYYIYFTDPNLKIVQSINYQNLTRGCHFTMDQLPDWRADQIAFAVGPQVSYLHRSCTHNERYTTFTINDMNGQASAACIADKTKKYCGYASLSNGLMGYIDQYGNESKITLKAVNDGSYLGIGRAMRLDDPANVHDEWPNRP